MPNADLHQKFDMDRKVFEFIPTYSRSGSTKDVSGGITCRTRWAPDQFVLADGIVMSIGGKDGTVGPGAAGTYAYLTIPLLGVSTSHTVDASTMVGATIKFEIDNLRVYSYNGGILEFRADAMRWYVDGVVRWSTGSVYLVNPFYFAAAGVPLIGIPAEWTVGAGYGPVTPEGYYPTSTTPGTTSVEVEVVGQGSHTVRETPAGSFSGFPVKIELTSVPSLECPCPAEALPTLACTNTDSITVQAYAKETETITDEGIVECDPCPPGLLATPTTVHLYTGEYETIAKASNIITVPNLRAKVHKVDPANYRALVLRGGMPKTTRGASSSCQTAFPAADPDDFASESTLEEVHPRQSAILGAVGAAVHALEDTFAYDIYAPAGKGATRYFATGSSGVTITPGSCHPEGGGGSDSDLPPCGSLLAAPTTCKRTATTSFGPTVDTRLANPSMLGFLDHLEPLGRYINYGSRLWSFLYWFPPNESPEGQTQWPMYGDAALVENFVWKGDQWLEQSLLPGDERTKLRTTLVSAPLANGCQGVFISNMILGVESSWWGDPTFKVDSTAPAEEIELDEDSASLWAFTDCSGSLDATGIELTPNVGEMQVRADFSIGSTSVKPFWYPHVSNRFVFDWEDSNVSKVTIQLVGESGSVIKLTEAKGEVFRPINPGDNKYAGSWAQDFDPTLIYGDVGFDDLPEGVSAAYMADPELVFAPSLLAGRLNAKIRFLVDVVSDASPVKLKYPKFRISDGASRVYQENKSQAAIVWPDGPGVRFGNQAFYYDSAHHATPIVLPPGIPPIGMKPSALDWLSWRRLVLESKAHDDGLGAEIAATWDTYEATTPAALDNFSTAWLIPSTDRVFPRCALGNGASCPPMLGVPRRARSTTTFEASGGWAQESVSFAVEPRWFVGNDTTNLYTPGGVLWTSAVPSLSGWPVTKMVQPVENDEGPTFHIRRGSKRIAKMSPWQGCFSVRTRGKVIRDLDLDNLKGLGLMFEVWVTDEDLTVVAYNLENPKYSKEAVAYVSPDVQTAAITTKSDGTLLVIFSELGAVYEIRSRSIGEYWGDRVSLGITGKWVDTCEDEARGLEFLIVNDHTAGSSGARPWKVYRKKAQSEAYTYLTTVVSQAEADLTGASIEFSDEKGRPLVFTFADAGVVRRFRSFNHGEKWVEV